MTDDPQDRPQDGPRAQSQDGRPVTGDRGVDEITAELHQSMGEPPEQTVAALTEAHRRLQARLSDPGPTPSR